MRPPCGKQGRDKEAETGKRELTGVSSIKPPHTNTQAALPIYEPHMSGKDFSPLSQVIDTFKPFRLIHASSRKKYTLKNRPIREAKES
jgi:hypothetical protein